MKINWQLSLMKEHSKFKNGKRKRYKLFSTLTCLRFIEKISNDEILKIDEKKTPSPKQIYRDKSKQLQWNTWNCCRNMTSFSVMTYVSSMEERNPTTAIGVMWCCILQSNNDRRFAENWWFNPSNFFQSQKNDESTTQQSKNTTTGSSESISYSQNVL